MPGPVSDAYDEPDTAVYDMLGRLYGVSAAIIRGGENMLTHTCHAKEGWLYPNNSRKVAERESCTQQSRMS